MSPTQRLSAPPSTRMTVSTSGRAMVMTRSGLPLPAHARRTLMRLAMMWTRPRRDRWPTLCAMMFLSRSVWMFPDKSVWQSQTRSAPTSHCRSARMCPGRTAKLATRRFQSGSAGRSLRRFVKMYTLGLLLLDPVTPLFLPLLHLDLRLLMPGKKLLTIRKLFYLREVKLQTVNLITALYLGTEFSY